MKIAVFSKSTIKHFSSGGMETQLQNLLEGLSKAGHSITVFTTSLPDFSGAEIEENKIKYLYISETTPGLNPLRLWEKPFERIGFLKRGVKREGKNNYYDQSAKLFLIVDEHEKFDLVLSQSTAALGLARGDFFDRKNQKTPLLAIIHGTVKTEIKNRLKSNKTIPNWGRFIGVDLPVWLWELYINNRIFFSKCSKVVAVSNDLKQQFEDQKSTYRGSVTVIPNGVNENLFKPSSKKNDIFTILFIGRIDREKGVEYIISAVKELVDKKLKLKAVLVGSGVQSHVDEFKSLVKELKIDNYINFVGAVENKKVPSFYQSASVFVLPTLREEGHPMVVSEAYCSGLPVIGSKKGGLKEQIIDQKTGYLIDPGNLDQLVEKIEYLYKNEKVLKEMGKEALSMGRNKYSMSAMIGNYDRLIRQISSKN